MEPLYLYATAAQAGRLQAAERARLRRSVRPHRRPSRNRAAAPAPRPAAACATC